MGWYLTLILGSTCLLLVVVIAAAYAAAFFLMWKDRRKDDRLRRTGVPVIAAVVQSNDGVLNTLIGQFLITFDPTINEPRVTLPILGVRMMSLKNTEPTDPDELVVAKLVSNERFYPWRRIRLPARFTGGPEVFVVYLNIQKHLLPTGELEEPWVECVATPGDRGEIEVAAALKQ